MRVVSVAVCALDSAIEPMNHELCFLVLTELPPCINGFLFGVVVAARSSGPTAFYIPASVWIRNHMMSWSGHNS